MSERGFQSLRSLLRRVHGFAHEYPQIPPTSPSSPISPPRPRSGQLCIPLLDEERGAEVLFSYSFTCCARPEPVGLGVGAEVMDVQARFRLSTSRLLLPVLVSVFNL